MVPKDRQGGAQPPQQNGRTPPVVTRRIAEEASAWIARLHGPSRSADMEREFREWIARSPAHGYAFERCTDIWTDVAALKPEQIAAGMARLEARAAVARERWWRRMRWPLWTLLALSIVAAAYALHRWFAVTVYSTEVGGQQQVLLVDGTRMSLNTDTRVRVDIDANRRSVRLDAGEVMFEVAKDPLRPFVVQAGGSQVVAVGTVFSVRVPGSSTKGHDAPVAIALIEGEVVVKPDSAGQAEGAAPERLVTLRPGERLRLAKVSGEPDAPMVPQVDRPPMEPLVAWKRGEAVFVDVSLGDAVSEMNRYTRTPITLVGNVAELRISGVYRIGESEGFAQAVAVLHGLKVREREGRLELAPPPQ